MRRYFYFALFFVCLMTGMLPALAQLTSPDVVWALAVRATYEQRWEDAVDAWQSIVAQKDWQYSNGRTEATLPLVEALWHVDRFDEARTLLVPLLQQSPASHLVQRALAQLAALTLRQHGTKAFEEMVAQEFDNPLIPAAVYWDYLGTLVTEVGVNPVDNAITYYLQTHAGSGNFQQIRLSQVQMLATAYSHAEACTRAAQGYGDAVGTPLELPWAETLAAEYAQTGMPEKAAALLNPLLACYPNKPELPKLIAQYQAQDTNLTAVRQQLADLPHTLDTTNSFAWQRQLSLDSPLLTNGAVYLLDAALDAYLAAHPDNPRRWDLKLVQIRTLVAKRDNNLAAVRAAAVLPLVTGTPYEVQVAEYCWQRHWPPKAIMPAPWRC